MSATPIVVLDYPRAADALRLVRTLGPLCRFYKVGSELFTAAGPQIVEDVRATGADVFLDLKFHDIPNTVRAAVRSAAALGARLVTVHASGGRAMVEAAVEGAGDGVRVLAVSVLTSLDERALAEAWGRPDHLSILDEVGRLAGLAAEAGAHGLVCSGSEVRSVREQFGDRLELLVPGIRLAGGATHDQARVVTPRRAADAGATYLVLGRAVTGAEDPAQAMRAVLSELS